MKVELDKHDLIMIVDSLEYMAELMKTQQKDCLLYTSPSPRD